MFSNSEILLTLYVGCIGKFFRGSLNRFTQTVFIPILPAPSISSNLLSPIKRHSSGLSLSSSSKNLNTFGCGLYNLSCSDVFTTGKTNLFLSRIGNKYESSAFDRTPVCHFF